MERLLGFDAQLLFDSAVTALNVLLLFGVLSYFLFNPIRNFLEQRRDRIAGQLENAGLLEEKGKKLKEEYEVRLRKAGWEAERILEEADKRAKRHQAELIWEAKEEAARIRERAEKDTELIKAKAMEEVRREAAGLAAHMAARLMAGMVDPGVQEQLIEKTLREARGIRWQS